MPRVDLDQVLVGPLMEVWGEPVRYQPTVGAARTITAIFDAEHEVILDELKANEIDAPGHSTRMPVLGVRLKDLPQAPAQGDRVTVAGVVYEVWDSQPDGQGYADLVLRKVLA